MLERLHSQSWLSVANDFGDSAQCRLRRGVKQGDVTSPILFAALINLLMRFMQHGGRGYCTSSNGEERVSGAAGAFVDDMFCLTERASEMQEFVNRIDAFSQWAGIEVNVKKSEITAIDHSTGGRLETDGIRFRNQPFTRLSPSAPFKYLGIRMTLTEDWSFEKNYIWKQMSTRLSCLRKAVVTPQQAELALESGVTSVFRYSAALVPWSTTELTQITRLWTAGMKAAWKFPRSCASALMTLPKTRGGRQGPDAHEIWLNDSLTLWQTCMSANDDLNELVQQDIRRTLDTFACDTFDQLKHRLRVHPFHHNLPLLARVVRKCDEVGLNSRERKPRSQEGHLCSMLLHNDQLAAVTKYRQRLDEWTNPGTASQRHGEGIRGIVPDNEDDAATVDGWQQSQTVNRALKALGVQGIRYVEQLVTIAGDWLQPASFGKSPHCSPQDIALLQQLLEAHTTTEVRRQWRQTWVGTGLLCPDSSHPDIRTALAASSSTAPQPHLSASSQAPSPLPPPPRPSGPLPPMLDGVIIGRQLDGTFLLESLPVPDARTASVDTSDLPPLTSAHLDDQDLAELFTSRRVHLSLPPLWFRTSDGSSLVSAECVPTQSLHSSILLYAEQVDEWAWLPIRGLLSLRSLVGCQPLSQCCNRRPWTVPRAAFVGSPLGTHPTLRAWSARRAQPAPPGSEWILRPARPDPRSCVTDLPDPRSSPDLGQPLLFSTVSELRAAAYPSTLKVQLAPSEKRPPRPTRDRKISFDLQVGVRQLLATDPDGWCAWAKNGGVVLTPPLPPAVTDPALLSDATALLQQSPTTLHLPQFASAISIMTATPLPHPLRTQFLPRVPVPQQPFCRAHRAPPTRLQAGVMAQLADLGRQAKLRDRPLLHRTLFDSVIHWTGSQLCWGADPVTWWPSFRQCTSPSSVDHPLSVPPPSQHPWTILLDEFPHEHRAEVLAAARSHAPGAVILASRAATTDLQPLLPAAPCVSFPQSARLYEVRGHWAGEAMRGSHDKGARVASKTIMEMWTLGPVAALSVPAYLQPAAWQGEWPSTVEAPPRPTSTPHNEAWDRFEQGAPYQTWAPHWVHAATDGSVNRGEGIMGAGIIRLPSSRSEAWSEAIKVPGKLSSLRAEAAALLRLLMHTDSSLDLLVYTDSLSLLQALMSWCRRDFRPIKLDKSEIAVINQIMPLLQARTGRTHFIKVKSHMGMRLNGWADELASQGARMEPPAPPTLPADDSDSLRQRRDAAHWIAEEIPAAWAVQWRDAPEPEDDEAPADAPASHVRPRPSQGGWMNTKAAVKRTVKAAVLQRSAALTDSRTTIFTEFLARPEAADVTAVMHTLQIPAAHRSVWMQLVAGFYPTQAYLHAIGRATSDQCEICHCHRETTGHFLCRCPGLHGACTKAHDEAWGQICAALTPKLPARAWHQWDRALLHAPLDLATVTRPDPVWPGAVRVYTPARLARLKPDGLVIDYGNRRITILEFTRPSDTAPGALAAATQRKTTKYSLIVNALREYRATGWEICLFPLTVGVRGTLQASRWDAALQALDISATADHVAIRRLAVRASIAGTHAVHVCRHRCRRSAPSDSRRQRCREDALATLLAFPPGVARAAR